MHDATEAWFYENKKSIDVYIKVDGRPGVCCRIPRHLLEDWLARTAPRGEKE